MGGQPGSKHVIDGGDAVEKPATKVDTGAPDSYGKIYAGNVPPPHMMNKNGNEAAKSTNAKPAAEPPLYSVPDMSKKTAQKQPAPKAADADLLYDNGNAAAEPPLYSVPDMSKKTAKKQPAPKAADADLLYDNGDAAGEPVQAPIAEPAYTDSDVVDHKASNTPGGLYTEVDNFAADAPGGSGPQYAEAELDDPLYASVDMVAAAPTSPAAPASVAPPSAGSMAEFLGQLGLLDKCQALADEQGIDEPGDFKMFSEKELVEQGFKVGHVRKILKALG